MQEQREFKGQDSTALQALRAQIEADIKRNNSATMKSQAKIEDLETTAETNQAELNTASNLVQKDRAFNRNLYVGALVIGLLIPAVSSVLILMLAPSSIPITLLTLLGGPSIKISALALSVIIPSVTALLTGITTLLIKRPRKQAQQIVDNLPDEIQAGKLKSQALTALLSSLRDEKQNLRHRETSCPTQAQITHHQALEKKIEAFHQTPSKSELSRLLKAISPIESVETLTPAQKETLFQKLFKLDDPLASKTFMKQLLSEASCTKAFLMNEVSKQASPDHYKAIQTIFQDQSDEVQTIQTRLVRIEKSLDMQEQSVEKIEKIIKRCDRVTAMIEGGTVPAISDNPEYQSAGVFDPTTAAHLLNEVQRIRFKVAAQQLQSMLEASELKSSDLLEFELSFDALKQDFPEDQVKLTTQRQRIETTLGLAVDIAGIARDINSFNSHPGGDERLDAIQLKINQTRQNIEAISDLNSETQQALFTQLDVRQTDLSGIQTKSADPIKGSPEYLGKINKDIKDVTQKAKALDPTNKINSKPLTQKIEAIEKSIEALKTLHLDETTRTDLQTELNLAKDLVQDKRTERAKVKIEEAIKAAEVKIEEAIKAAEVKIKQDIQATDQQVQSLKTGNKDFKGKAAGLRATIQMIEASIQDSKLNLNDTTQTDLQTQLGSTIQRLDAKDEEARHINQVKIEKDIQAVTQQVTTPESTTQDVEVQSNALRTRTKGIFDSIKRLRGSNTQGFKDESNALRTQIKDIQASIENSTIGLDKSTQTELKTALRQAQAALKQQELRSTVEKPLRGAPDTLASILDLKSQSSNDPNERTFQECLAVFEYDLEALQEAIKNPEKIKDEGENAVYPEGTRALVTQLDADTHARLQEKYIEAQKAEMHFQGFLDSTQRHIRVAQEDIDATEGVLDAGTQALLKAEFNIIEQIAAVNLLTFELVSFDANTPPKLTEHQEKLTEINELIKVIESAIEEETELADSSSVTLSPETQAKLKAQLTLAQKHIDQACIHRLTVSPKQQILELRQEVEGLVASHQPISIAEYKTIYEKASRIKDSLKHLDQSMLSSIGLSPGAQDSVLSEFQGLKTQLAQATLCASVSDLEARWDKKTLFRNIQAARAQPITARIQAITRKVEALDPTNKINSKPLTEEITDIKALIQSFASAFNQKTQSGLNTQLDLTTELLKDKKTKRADVKAKVEIEHTIDEATQQVTTLTPQDKDFKNKADALRTKIKGIEASLQDQSTVDSQAQGSDDPLHTKLAALDLALTAKKLKHQMIQPKQARTASQGRTSQILTVPSTAAPSSFFKTAQMIARKAKPKSPSKLEVKPDSGPSPSSDITSTP